MVTLETVPSASVLDGNPGSISAIFALTLSIASSGFAPYLATTTPPTASAPPLSRPPRRVAGPNWILATSLRRIGTLFRTVTTLFSRSSRVLMYPLALIKYSIRLNSIVRAPISKLLFFTAAIICITFTP